ncbi:MAG: hypothetical protein ACUVQG_10335 [Thermogutta sp.]
MVKSISYCSLFAMTPRAGRWNHRYLVPPGTVWTEKELAEQVSEADARPMGRDYVAIVRTATQTSTGRRASEMLILTDPRLAQLSPKDRDEVAKKLREYSDRLEDLITRQIDWEKAGSPLVVERPELGIWQRELESTLSRLLGPATAFTERTAVVGRKAASGRFQVRKCGVVSLRCWAW